MLKNFLRYLVVLILVGICTSAGATNDPKNILPFDHGSSYDIYFEANDEHDRFVVKDIEIVRFQEIYGKTFLVIKSYGFNLKESEGYILFDSISAILPNREFKINQVQGIKIH